LGGWGAVRATIRTCENNLSGEKPGFCERLGAMTAILERTPVSYALHPSNGTSIFGATVGAIDLQGIKF